ncbi:hypothetical protein VA7868_02486 [Vibrio aerogenes CECT 7868]|uniref:Uncharacterized protein n=1 Tax=Vibrio aerogenes CECT 7868 TaxID=1216006 RepID=A0A1M5ZAJ3_9VIBR|nr:hypothetical protein [Vibrio aerogenes]SHI21158.1 hypothetical protein VA7868_02486 [Vibrio aerogenes CECT 7868]
MKRSQKIIRYCLLGYTVFLSGFSDMYHVTASFTYASMALPNDARLTSKASLARNKSAPGWTQGASIVQGIPRGDTTPAYWANEILDPTLTTSAPWHAITLWVTIFEQIDNQMKDVRVKMKDADIWLLRSTDGSNNPATAKWENITPQHQAISWAAYYSSDMKHYISDADYRISSDNTNEYELHSQGYPIHGGTNVISFNADNILAAFVRVKAWLVPENEEKIKNSQNAKILLSVGADYYPSAESSVAGGSFANANYLPGVGGSRFQYLSLTPTWFYMGTVAPDDLSTVDKSSLFYQSGGKTSLTKSEWMANPPPVGY